jgi:hypothetical protein
MATNPKFALQFWHRKAEQMEPDDTTFQLAKRDEIGRLKELIEVQSDFIKQQIYHTSSTFTIINRKVDGEWTEERRSTH